MHPRDVPRSSVRGMPVDAYGQKADASVQVLRTSRGRIVWQRSEKLLAFSTCAYHVTHSAMCESLGYNAKELTQDLTAAADAEDGKRLPPSHWAPLAMSLTSDSLPNDELAEVTNAASFFPVKSLDVRKSSIGHAATPHHTGAPMNTTS